MELSRDDIELRSTDDDLFEPWLDRCGGRVLELGCGDGRHARTLAAHDKVESVLAVEVDRTQHAKNLAAAATPKLRFELGGAESIPAEDGSFDMVFMFKSLHHVPVDRMDRALAEIHRVLRPEGIAYISEPIFAGRFNEILALFHDESDVRRRAFEALVRAIDQGSFALEEEHFFLLPMVFSEFDEFEAKVIGATHTDHQLSPELLARVRERFEQHRAVNGGEFWTPQRVDVLRRCSR